MLALRDERGRTGAGGAPEESQRALEKRWGEGGLIISRGQYLSDSPASTVVSPGAQGPPSGGDPLLLEYGFCSAAACLTCCYKVAHICSLPEGTVDSGLGSWSTLLTQVLPGLSSFPDPSPGFSFPTTNE